MQLACSAIVHTCIANTFALDTFSLHIGLLLLLLLLLLLFVVGTSIKQEGGGGLAEEGSIRRYHG